MNRWFTLTHHHAPYHSMGFIRDDASPQPMKMGSGRANGDELHRRNLLYIFKGVPHSPCGAPAIG